MTIGTGSIGNNLWPGLNAQFGKNYNEHRLQYKDFMHVKSSDKNFELYSNEYGLGLAQVQPEGTGVPMAEMANGPEYRFVHVQYGLGFTITEIAIEDDLYLDSAQKNTNSLAFGMRQAKENVSAAILNNAFDSNFTYFDGVELSSSVHPLSKGGTSINELVTPADFSEGALEQALIDLGDMTDDAGLRISVMPKKLIVPNALQMEASRVLNTTLRPSSANNDINAINHGGMIPQGFSVNNYLTNAKAWFIITDAPEGITMFDRIKLSFKNDSDFETGNQKMKARERYSVGVGDWRGCFCVEGT